MRAAAAIDVVEPPDFSDSIATPTVVTLGVGTHTVSGHVDYNASDRYDIIYLYLLPGAQLVGVTFYASNYEGQSDEQGNFGFFNAPGTSFAGFEGSNTFASNGTWGPADPKLGYTKVYWPVWGVSAASLNFDGSLFSESTAALDWTWTFTVEEAPQSPDDLCFPIKSAGGNVAMICL